MWSDEIVLEAVKLFEKGLNPTEVSRRINVSRGTVYQWRSKSRKEVEEKIKNTCQNCGNASHKLAKDMRPSYSYLLGLYLGDGCISSHPRNVFRFRVCLDKKYPNIVTGCIESINSLEEAKTVAAQDYKSYIEVSSFSKSWPCLFPQHGSGKKHERLIELADWQKQIAKEHPKELLKGLIHSDGCRCIMNDRGIKRPLYQFKNLSTDILDIFSWTCDLLDINHTRPASGKYISIHRKKDVAFLDTFIGPKS